MHRGVPVLEEHVGQGLVAGLVKTLDGRLGGRVLTTRLQPAGGVVRDRIGALDTMKDDY